jgi:hypothetical protein
MGGASSRYAFSSINHLLITSYRLLWQKPTCPPRKSARMLIFKAWQHGTLENELCYYLQAKGTRKRVQMLVFEGGCRLSPPPSPTTLETSIHARFRGRLSFVTITTSHHPRKRARMLVFEGGCLPPLLPPPISVYIFFNVILVYHRTMTIWVGLWLSVSSARTTEQIEPPGGRAGKTALWVWCSHAAMAHSSR